VALVLCDAFNERRVWGTTAIVSEECCWYTI